MPMPKLNRDIKAFNQKVMDALRTTSPAHADELNAHGSARGWWDMVSYFRVMYKTPQFCAAEIAKKPLNAQ